MSQDAYLETDQSITWGIYLSYGTIAGNLLARFLAALSDYYDASAAEKTEITTWFSPIIETVPSLHSLAEAWYGGEWEYNEEEYEKFLVASPEASLSQEDFMTTIRQVKQKWTDLKLVVESVLRLNRFLEENNPIPTWWYIPGETEKELSALESTLRQVEATGARKVRIKFI